MPMTTIRQRIERSLEHELNSGHLTYYEFLVLMDGLINNLLDKKFEEE